MTGPVVNVRDDHRTQVDRAVDQITSWDIAHRRKAKRICYRTVFAECDWWNLANASVPESLLYPHDDGLGKDKDSVGLYQQRALWWGDTKGSMDPFTATQRFLAVMVRNTPGWFVGDESTTCQNTQGSQFDGITIDPKTGKPYPFAQNYREEQNRVDAMELDLSYFGNGGT